MCIYIYIHRRVFSDSSMENDDSSLQNDDSCDSAITAAAMIVLTVKMIVVGSGGEGAGVARRRRRLAVGGLTRRSLFIIMGAGRGRHCRRTRCENLIHFAFKIDEFLIQNDELCI